MLGLYDASQIVSDGDPGLSFTTTWSPNFLSTTATIAGLFVLTERSSASAFSTSDTFSTNQALPKACLFTSGGASGDRIMYLVLSILRTPRFFMTFSASSYEVEFFSMAISELISSVRFASVSSWYLFILAPLYPPIEL